MKQSKLEKRITVRLDNEAILKLEEAKGKGYTTSQYINNLIKGSAVIDIGQHREFASHLCELERLLEDEEDSEWRRKMREEADHLWRCLR